MPLAGKLLIAERMWLKTQSMVALLVNQNVLANVWWPFRFKDDIANAEKLEKVLALWLNSTLSLLIMLSSREKTPGAWVDFKEPVLLAYQYLMCAVLAYNTWTNWSRPMTNWQTNRYPRYTTHGADPMRAEIDSVIAKTCKSSRFFSLA